MSTSLAFRFTAGIALVMFSQPVQPNEQETLQQRCLELEREVIRTRLAVPSGEATVRVQQRPGSAPRHWKLWFEGENLRMEVFNQAGERTKVIVKNASQTIVRSVSATAVTGESAVVTSVYTDGNGSTELLDLRKIGLFPVPVGALYVKNDWDYFVANPEKERTHFSSELIDDRDSVKIVMKASNGDESNLWIDRDRGRSLVRIEHTAQPKGREVFRDTFAIKLGQFDGSWFPREVVRQRQVGSRKFSPETTRLEDVRLNHDIDDELFTLASVGVSPGESVNIYPVPKDNSTIGDGSELVISKQPTEPPVADRNLPWRMWLTTGNIVLGATLLLLFLLQTRKQVRQSDLVLFLKSRSKYF